MTQYLEASMDENIYYNPSSQYGMKPSWALTFFGGSG